MGQRCASRLALWVASAATLVAATACGTSDSSESGDTGPDSTTAGTEAATSTVAPQDTTGASPTREQVVVPAPSLDGNLLGEPSEIEVVVEVPPSYSASPDRRYPVVYFLAGYDESASVTSISVALQHLVEEGEAPEMILVGVSGDNALGGSFYVDSPVSGGWAGVVVDDVVGAIDAGYRTLAAPESRGIAGFSMGGYGALHLAMLHPDVFGAVYALSPGLFAPDGLAASQMFADAATIAGFVAAQQELAALAPDEAADEMLRAFGRDGDVRFSLAYGAAFAADPAAGPPYVRYPYTDPDAAPDAAIWAQWEHGYGGIAQDVDQYRDNLLALGGIVIDYGTQDSYAWIPPGCEHLAAELERAGVPHRLERFEGGHGPLAPRAEAVMVPFFADVLVAAP